MPNIFLYIIKFKGNLKPLFRLVANIYQYKIDNIMLTNGTLSMSPENKMLNFPVWNLNNIKT